MIKLQKKSLQSSWTQVKSEKKNLEHQQDPGSFPWQVFLSDIMLDWLHDRSETFIKC